MKTEKIIFDVNIKQINVFGNDNTFKNIVYCENVPDCIDCTHLDSNQISIVNNFINFCDTIRRQSKPILDEPSGSGEPVYILQTKVLGDNITAKVYDLNYYNDKNNQVIRIDVRVIHYDENGNRVPEWDADTYIIADMTDERKIIIPGSDPEVSEYSYELAETFLQNGMSINQLISMAIQLAEFETNSLFLERIYGNII